MKIINEMKKGMTLIEILLVIAILGILFTSLVVGINPAKQLKKARDTERETDLFQILSVVYQYTSEHSGELPDTDGDPDTSNFPTSSTCVGTGGGCFDLGAAGETGDTITPEYLVEIPKDPKIGSDADTGYTIYVDANNHLIASASGETRDIGLIK